jgi:hypothetical protein
MARDCRPRLNKECLAQLLSIGTQKGPPIGVQKGPLWYGSLGLSR